MAASGSIEAQDLKGALDRALEQVNGKLEGRQVAAVEGKDLKAKEPIFLELVAGGEGKAIGITHFAKLTPTFEDAEFQEVARTIDELTESILKAVQIHDKAVSDPDVLITVAGTPFFKKGVNVEIREGILFLEGKQILFKGTALEARRLCGEEGLTFSKMADGDYRVDNPVDEREGKGIYFRMPSGEVDRDRE